MSEDLIRRSDAIKVAKEFWYKPDIAGALAELPAIEPKQGEWIEVQISEQFKRMVCSECGNSYVTDMITPLEAWIDNRHRFCPNCGADMRGTDDEASD